jgi:hypothetical protein
MTDTTQRDSGSSDFMRSRALNLQQQGLDQIQAWGIALLETRVQVWPEAWGDNLPILLYGDFEPPDTDIEFPSLGITVRHEKVEDTLISAAHCVLEAVVRVHERNLVGVIDAIRRINLLLGALTLEGWGNYAVGWWSHILHGSFFEVHFEFPSGPIELTLERLVQLSPPVRQRIEAALYWIREPKKLFRESHHSDHLRLYAGYWNAFECLVEAVNILRPRKRLSKADKQRMIEEFVAERGGRLTTKDIQQCYQEIVNPGLVAKASHALRVCFGEDAEPYISECFLRPDRHNRLYDIRNAINHGDIDAENPEELLRVEARLTKLWFIVWGMFGRFIPFTVPVDSTVTGKNAKRKE